jgi:hypothetical protein
MSASKLFPQFRQVPPNKLQKAVEEMAAMNAAAGRINIGRWETLLDKLRSRTPLTNFEKKQLTANCGGIPDNLQESFSELFRRNLDEDVLADVSQAIAFNLAPSKAIALLTHQEIRAKFGDTHLPPGVFQALDKLGRDPDEQNWVDLAIRNSMTPKDLIASLQPIGFSIIFSVGQKRIIRRILSSKATSAIVNMHFPSIFDLLSALRDKDSDSIELVDILLGNYFQFDSNWSGKVLDERFFLNNLVSRLPDLSSRETRINQYRNIELLRRKISEISNVLKELNAVEPDRGTFWRKYLPQCHYVEPKRISRTAVAVAFAFPNFVIVEFAPVGRAALLYDRNIFDSTIRSREDWRTMESVKACPPYSTDGRLVHHSDWQGKFNEMITLLLRQGWAGK